MEQYLELQIRLVGAVQAVYRAENLILKVHMDRKKAEERVSNVTQEANALKDRLNTMYNVTDTLISNAENFSTIYGNLTKDLFDELNESVSGLDAEKGIFARESSAQADQAREASEKAVKLLANANMARKDSADTLRELENMDISFKQLEEKMTELDRLMKKLDTGDKLPDDGADEEDSSPSFADPTKLMQEVQNYTTALEKDTEEIKVITSNLKQLETESATLQQEMNNYVEQFNRMAEHLSKHTKFHRTCK
ncbi:hypothetical protein FGIG_11816 [Fasciola gigantica]|uniref:Uncharacterized protein n=1 Tax=Fasciola gigantica TaxID=46835 RepID=A0A504Z4I7_FASGI|nr:hypothetical protein FGIG_11816 [Fasciola gigantica]